MKCNSIYDLTVLQSLISCAGVRSKNQVTSSQLFSIKVRYIFLVLAISIILSFSQNLFGQENSKNINGETPKAKLVESYSSFKGDEASMIIDLLRVEVGKNPNSYGFIIMYCGKVCQYGEIEAHLRGIELSLQLKGVNTKQFVVKAGGFKEKTTAEFWLVPENACPPIPNSLVNFKDVKFKGIYKRKVVDYECCF